MPTFRYPYYCIGILDTSIVAVRCFLTKKLFVSAHTELFHAQLTQILCHYFAFIPNQSSDEILNTILSFLLYPAMIQTTVYCKTFKE